MRRILTVHSGGFATGSAAAQDALLSRIADDLSLVAVSVEYRLAPEHPFPAGGDDCLDACLFALSADGAAKLGGTLRAMGGDSAGAYLTVRVALQLRDQGINVREKIAAIVPSYGIFDLNYTPSVNLHDRRIVMGTADTKRFIDVGFPPDKFTSEVRRLPEWSPLYADLRDLPAALFLVGSADPLIDDSVFMGNRWFLAGNTTEVKIVQEGCHGFTIFPMGDMTDEGAGEIVKFLRKHLG